MVKAKYGYVSAAFEYKNFEECLPEQDAADAADF